MVAHAEAVGAKSDKINSPEAVVALYVRLAVASHREAAADFSTDFFCKFRPALGKILHEARLPHLLSNKYCRVQQTTSSWSIS